MNIPFQKLKIDSLKLRLPKSAVHVLDSTFNEKYQKLYLSTGEIAEDVNLDKHKVSMVDGISFRFGLGSFRHGSESEEMYFFQINAKMLGHQYFEGITENTIRKIYDYILSLQYCTFKYSDFMMNSWISDIDLCKDFKADPEELGNAIMLVANEVTVNNYRYMDKPFRRKDNVGLQFNKREKATPAKPFCKFYHKTLELQFQSQNFAEVYLSGIDFQDVARFETTIKNSRFKTYHKVSYNSLHDFFQIPSDKLNKMYTSALPSYTTEKILFIDKDGISPKDKMILILLNRCIQKGDDIQNILFLLDEFENAQQRRRMNNLLRSLIERLPERSQQKIAANERTLNILRQTGLFD